MISSEYKGGLSWRMAYHKVDVDFKVAANRHQKYEMIEYAASEGCRMVPNARFHKAVSPIQYQWSERPDHEVLSEESSNLQEGETL